MTLSIDLCVNMKKITSLTPINNHLENLANKYNASFSYSTHELEGIGHKIIKHNYIYNLSFNDNKNLELKKLIREIKQFKYITIDNIIIT